eukprot:TRINITY_DN21954_c0_g1_i2.p1 TRINITY_DN21954_c0_g1~~TRINITY_DN21954_c0_g1_i2.p1  ORF type:complete len:372 (+),score=90.64 TRINITY_DN21954_c0_g1_i2:336-1451(+)
MARGFLLAMHAVHVFCGLASRRLEAATSSFNVAMAAGLSPEAWRKALRLADRLEKEGGEANAVTESTTVAALEAAAHWQGAFEAMRRRSSDKAASRQGFSTLDASSVRSALSSIGASSVCWPLALDVVMQLASKGTASTACFTAAITTVDQAGLWEVAFALLAAMEAAQVEMDVICLSAAASVCAKSGLWERALALLSLGEKHGISLDVMCCSNVMAACESCGEAEVALRLLREMRQNVSLEADAICHSSVVAACAEAAFWESASDLVRSMRGDILETSVISCNAMMSALERGCAWRLCGIAMAALKRPLLEFNEVSYSSAIRAAGHGRRWLDALAMLDRGRGCSGDAEGRLWSAAVYAEEVAHGRGAAPV